MKHMYFLGIDIGSVSVKCVLIDGAGHLIGVATAIYSPSGASAGIGFAVPVDTVKRIVPILIQDGRIPTPAIGVGIAAEGAAIRLGIDGLVVASVVPGSPAQRAGLRGLDRINGVLGDIITHIDDKPIRSHDDYYSTLETYEAGDRVKVTCRLGDKVVTYRLELVESQ